MEKSRIRDKHPGSATLVSTDPIESRLKPYPEAKDSVLDPEAVFWIISIRPVLRIRIGSGLNGSSDPGGQNGTQKSKKLINFIF